MKKKVKGEKTKESFIKTSKLFYRSLGMKPLELKKEVNILAAEGIKRTNIFSRLLKSFNFLLWGDV